MSFPASFVLFLQLIFKAYLMVCFSKSKLWMHFTSLQGVLLTQGGGHSGELKRVLLSLQNQGLRLTPESQQSLILYLLLCLLPFPFYNEGLC